MKMSIAVTGALCAAAVTTAALSAKPTTRNRAEIPAEFRWDFSSIYPNWAAWEEGMKEMDARMDAFAKLQGTLAHVHVRIPAEFGSWQVHQPTLGEPAESKY